MITKNIFKHDFKIQGHSNVARYFYYYLRGTKYVFDIVMHNVFFIWKYIIYFFNLIKSLKNIKK
jgi:hypothetical protein